MVGPEIMKISGRFDITSIDAWDDDYINAEEQAYIQFHPDGTGELCFGHVRCELDCRQVMRDGRQAIEFSFEGSDESDSVSGRGWGVQKGQTLAGYIYFHMGEESRFTAERG